MPAWTPEINPDSELICVLTLMMPPAGSASSVAMAIACVKTDATAGVTVVLLIETLST